MSWLEQVSYLGIPRGGWLIVLAVLVCEAILGKAQNPKLRSTVGAVLTLVAWVASFIPGIGPLIAKILQRPPEPPISPPPPAVAALFLGLALGALPACHHDGPGPNPPVAGTVIDCTVKAVRDTAVNALPAVSSALASGDWMGELLKLVGRIGEEALDCAVQRLTGEAMAAARATGDPVSQAKAEHGRAWLEGRGVKFASPSP